MLSSAEARSTVNYCSRTLERACLDIINPENQRLDLEAHPVALTDMRPFRGELSLDREGVVLLDHKDPLVRDPRLLEENLVQRYDHSEINEAYLRSLTPIVKDVSRAHTVVPVAGGLIARLSSRATKATALGVGSFAHLDFTRQGLDYFLNLTETLSGERLPAAGRIKLLQTWRPVTEPPHDSVLAICDGRSVSQDGLVYMDTYVAKRGTPGDKFESRLCRYDSAHRWLYAPDMSPDEIMVFKGFDTDHPEAMNAMHCAIVEEGHEEANPRGSIETRFFAFYD